MRTVRAILHEAARGGHGAHGGSAATKPPTVVVLCKRSDRLLLCPAPQGR
jgi:hypothetical protein